MDEETYGKDHNPIGSKNGQSKNELSDERHQLKEQSEMQTENTLQKKEEVRVYQPLIPFPQRMKQSKLDDQFAKFLNMFKKLEINIPFVEALAQMPHYEKFMKDIISEKRKLDENGVVSLSTNCSAIIKKNLPLKMHDPGSLTIPCTIGNHEFGKLCVILVLA